MSEDECAGPNAPQRDGHAALATATASAKSSGEHARAPKCSECRENAAPVPPSLMPAVARRLAKH